MSAPQPERYPESSWPPVFPRPPAPRIRRPGLVTGLVFAVMLALCGGGGGAAGVVVQNAEPRGTADPEAAVEGFLTAIFTDHSATNAATFVCPDARDDKQLAQLVFEVKEFEERYSRPRTTWTYPPVQSDGPRASATVTLTLTTANDQVAEKRIRLLLVDERGWWVCDVETPD